MQLADWGEGKLAYEQSNMRQPWTQWMAIVTSAWISQSRQQELGNCCFQNNPGSTSLPAAAHPTIMIELAAKA